MAKITVLKTGIESQQLSKYMIRFKTAIGAWELPATTSSRADEDASRQQPCPVPRACWLRTPLAPHRVMTSQAPLHRRSKGRLPAQREHSRALGQSSKRKFKELEITPSEAPMKSLGDAKAMRSQLANCQRSQKRWKQTAQAARTEILEKYAWLSITQAVLKAGQSDYLAAEAEVASLRQQLEAALRKGADLEAKHHVQQQQLLYAQGGLKFQLPQRQISAAMQAGASSVSSPEDMVSQLQEANPGQHHS
jgi:hypothetical protein